MDWLGLPHLTRPPRRPPRPGDLLVSSPSLTDPRFRRTVVYLLQHDDEGSAGVVINRRFERSLAGLDLPEWVVDSAIVREGGPVSDDSLLALASTETAPGHLRRAVGPQVCVVDLDEIRADEQFQPLQLFVGYAGWAAGQLAGEIGRDDWLVVSSDPCDVLATDPERVWDRVLRRQRGHARLWATLPEAVTAN